QGDTLSLHDALPIYFSRGGRTELAEKEAAEIKVIEGYLPAAVSDDEIVSVVEEVIRATGASSSKDIGTVMKQTMSRFAGKPLDRSEEHTSELQSRVE